MKKKSNWNVENWIARILCGYVMLFPWIIWKKELLFTAEEQLVVAEEIVGVLDIALYGKAVITILAGLLLAILLYYKRFSQKQLLIIEKTKLGRVMGMCLIIFAAGSILSALLGGHMELALQGNVNSCEGLWVWLSYVILLVAALEVAGNAVYQKWFKKALIGLCYITVGLSCIEFFYKPVLEILMPEIWNTEYENMVVLTLYNPSYYAMFGIILFAVAGGYFLQAENVKEEILTGIAAGGMLFCAIASKSTGAFYLLIVESVLFMAYLIWKKRNLRKLIIIVGMGLGLLAANWISDGKLMQVASETSVNETRALHEENYFLLTDIIIEDKMLRLVGSEHTLQVQMNEAGVLTFSNEKGELATYEEKESKLKFTDVFEPITVWVENGDLTFDLGYRGNLHFYMYQGNFYPSLSNGSIVNDISGNGYWQNPFSHFATGRGWYWLGSMDTLKQCLILGKGMGSFQLYFKQFDFVGLLNTQGTTELIIDKPHCMYIQMAVQSGVPAMLAFIVMAGGVLLTGMKILWKRKEMASYLGYEFGLGGFLVFSIITDSMVVVSPLVWILIGTLAGCLMKNDD